MRCVVPFDGEHPKTRLGPVLSRDERRAFADAMLADVLDAVEAAGGDPEVLATGPTDADVPVTVDDRPLTDAVNAVLESAGATADDPLAVVTADLALATPTALSRLFSAEGELALVPGRGGGTNAFVARTADFRVDYHGASFRDHVALAARLGVSPTVVDSMRLSTDVDEPADLVEVLLHAEGRAAAWLRDAGFDVVVDGGRVEARRA